MSRHFTGRAPGNGRATTSRDAWAPPSVVKAGPVPAQARETSWRVMGAGIVDAGVSSIATLAVGIYAARTLPHAEFGAYALFNSAFLLGAVVPAFLVLAPAAISTVS